MYSPFGKRTGTASCRIGGGGGLLSHGSVAYQNGNGENVVLDSRDFYHMEQMIDDCRSWRDNEYTEGYDAGKGDVHGDLDNHTLRCEHHFHVDANGPRDDAVIYSLTSPGGCYGNAGHTHDVLMSGYPDGKCPWYYYTSIKCDCTGKFVGEGEEQHWVSCYRHKHTCRICGRVSRSGDPSCKHKAYTCDNRTNTWTIKCGKTPATIEYREFLFTEPILEYQQQLNSHGILQLGDESISDKLLFNMSEFDTMGKELTQTACGFQKAAVDKFLKGCYDRGNSHGITSTEYIMHTHTSKCYQDGRLVCGEIPGESIDGLRVYYQGGYLFHIHEGEAADGSTHFEDDVVLHQTDDPGGCFVGLEHEHSELCIHHHTEDCYDTCDCEVTYEPIGSTYRYECPLPNCYTPGYQGIYQKYQEVHSIDCGVIPHIYTKQIDCNGCNRSGAVYECDTDDVRGSKVDNTLTSYVHDYMEMTCGMDDETDYDCDGAINVWVIGCGRSTADRED